jgi:hypothetical protein
MHRGNIGVGGVGVFLGSLKQKILGSNPVATYPERRALRTQLSWVYTFCYATVYILLCTSR